MSYRYILLSLVLLLPGLAKAQDPCPVPALLEILAPGDIMGIYDAGTQSGDGSWGDTTGLIPPGVTAQIVHVEDDGTDPGEACVPITNPGEIAGNIALIRRGECEFGLKAKHAQEAGAVGFIIYNDERVPDDDEEIIIMGGGANGIEVTIPGIFVSRATGLAMVEQLKFGFDVQGNMRYYDCWVTVAIEPGPDGTPGTHALSAARPNPFNGRAAFTLEVAQAQEVVVEVYNTLGQRVAVLHEGMMAPGAEHLFTIEATSLPSGVYFYRATGETFSQTRSVVLTR